MYTGNVHDPASGTTFCPSCGVAVMARDWYDIADYAVDGHGRCRACGTHLLGVYDGAAGPSGQRRLPVRLAASRS
jgi:pyruvate formate lyase activating enzyme